MSGATGFGPGLFGKLPARGDFVARGLPEGFRQPWEDWLHDLWQDGWNRFGRNWAPLLEDGPLWRFVIEAGLCGHAAVAGLLTASSDRLGRAFPLTVVAAVPEGCDPAALPITASLWFNRAEALLRSARDPALDLDRFEQRLRALGPPKPGSGLPEPAPGTPGWRIALDPVQAPALAYPALIRDLAATLPDRYSLWWSLGSPQVEPSMVVANGLPEAGALTALFDGAWDSWGWGDADTLYPEED